MAMDPNLNQREQDKFVEGAGGETLIQVKVVEESPAAGIEKVQGDVAHDAVDSGNPVKIGGISYDATPYTIANGDRVNAWFLPTGAQAVAVSNGNGDILAMIQENEQFNATKKGILVYGLDIESTPNKYRQTALDASGHAYAHLVDNTHTGINPATEDTLQLIQAGTDYIDDIAVYSSQISTNTGAISSNIVNYAVPFWQTAEQVLHGTSTTDVVMIGARVDGSGSGNTGDAVELNVNKTGGLKCYPSDGATDVAVVKEGVGVISGAYAFPSFVFRDRATGAAVFPLCDSGDVRVIGTSGFYTGGTITPGVGTINLGKAEDAAITSSSTGIMMLCASNDNGATTLVNASNDYTMLAVDRNGRVFTLLTDGSGNLIVHRTLATDTIKTVEAVPVAAFTLSESDTAIVPIVDESSQAIVTVDFAHHETHAGDAFLYTDAVELNSGASQDYLITTPNTTKWAHMVFVLDGSAITQFELYETADRTGTTAQTLGNANRNSATTATITVHKGTSGGTTDGTLIHIYKGGSATGISSRGGAGTRNDEEIILKQNTKYILRVTSGTNNNLTNVRLRWYEHTASN